MFTSDNGKTYDCPYCHNQGDNNCSRGTLVGGDTTSIIHHEGAQVLVDFGVAIQPGDTYLAKRNGGWKLLTCRSVDPRHWIQPVENAYTYDTWECAKVLSIT